MIVVQITLIFLFFLCVLCDLCGKKKFNYCKSFGFLLKCNHGME
jgi:hypothetical protein